MKDTAYAFAVSAIRVRETGLLSRADFEALITAQDENAALRMLEDRGYTGITEDTEGTLSQKMSDVTEFIRELVPDFGLFSFLFVQNDFHNLKAAMKCAVSGISPDEYFLPSVLVSHEKIKAVVNEKRFSDLPELFIESASAAWNAVTSGANGQLCEMILDRAATEASVKIAQEKDDAFCEGFAKLRQKLSAILIAYRCAATGKSRDFIGMALPDTESPDKDRLVSAALSGCDEVLKIASGIGIPLEKDADASDVVFASNALEDEYISKSVFVSMGVSPVIAYYLRSEREIARIRVILSCKRCGFSESMIRKRTGF